MKKLSMFVLGLALLQGVAFAEPAIDWFDNLEGEQQRVEVDAPYLVNLAKDWNLGASVSKDLHGTNSDQGYAFVGKVTYTGTLFKNPFGKSK